MTTTQFAGKISVSQHATARATEHFRVPRPTADEWIRTNLRRATFIANIVGEDGKRSRLYAHQRIAFVLADTEDYVLTVYPQHQAGETIRAKVADLVARELRKLERKERATERAVAVEKAKIAVQIAECRLKMTITPSARVVATNTAAIRALETKAAELDRMVAEVKREKSTFAKGVVMYV